MDISQITQNLEGPAWLIAVVGGVLMAVKVLYQDIFRDYLRQRLELQMQYLKHHVDSVTMRDLVEGQYHLLGRALISSANGLRDCVAGLEAADVEHLLRAQMGDVFSRSIRSLHEYTHMRSGKKLDAHLRMLTKEQKSAIYRPVVEALIRTADPTAIRNAGLVEVDRLVSNGLEFLSSGAEKREKRGIGYDSDK